MTLIAAFRCDHGVAACADSQETVGDYRVSVDKIAPREVGHYELVIGGAGNSGGLIDDFSENFARTVESWPEGLTEDGIRVKIRKALLEFHREEVAHFPAAPENKRLEFIICIKQKLKHLMSLSKEFHGYHLWKTDGTSIVTVRDFTLLGFDDAIYTHETQRLYSPQITMAQAVMLGINLFSIAKATSNYIGGPTQVITVRLGGMVLMRPGDVSDLEQRAATFNHALAELVLACPDLSIHNDEFQELLENFGKRVMQLREQYFQLAATDELDRLKNDPNFKGPPFPILPGGMLIGRGADGKVELIPHDQTAAFMEMVNRTPPAKVMPTWEKMKRAAKKKKPGQRSKPRTSKGRQ